MYRIAGNLRRLERNAYRGKLDLKTCYLGCVDLQKYRGQDILGYIKPYLNSSNLKGVNIAFAELRDVDLRNVKNLTLGQLSEVKSLYMTKLDPELMEQIEEKYPHLLEEPVE